MESRECGPPLAQGPGGQTGWPAGSFRGSVEVPGNRFPNHPGLGKVTCVGPPGQGPGEVGGKPEGQVFICHVLPTVTHLCYLCKVAIHLGFAMQSLGPPSR